MRLNVYAYHHTVVYLRCASPDTIDSHTKQPFVLPVDFINIAHPLIYH